MTLRYIADPFRPTRRPTRVVRVGDVGVGGDNPLRIQSMTTTDTQDTRATADQAERLADAGCEIVRITAPSARDAENLGEIAAELRRRGVRVPLVADIHFVPNAAMIAAEHVEKIRVNPGNYADKKRFEVREYSDAQYAEELQRVAERFRPLVRRCRELGRAMRIGTNHGSLSDRILNRFGDTPRGMVESALEFLDVCEDEGFHDVVFSMKASNTQVAIQAYRMLAARLAERAGGFHAPSYPLHLGVTEAGDGEDGRVKSAIGIGALLEDGLGDTLRVSLTEDPVKEVPVARALAARFESRRQGPAVSDPGAPAVADPYVHQRRGTRAVATGPFASGAAEPVRVEIDLGPVPLDVEAGAAELREALARSGELATEGLRVEASDEVEAARASAFADALTKAGIEAPLAVCGPPSLAARLATTAARVVVRVDEPVAAEALEAGARAARAAGVPLEWQLAVPVASLAESLDAALAASDAAGLEALLFGAAGAQPVHGARLVAARLAARNRGDLPLVLHHRSDPFEPEEAALLRAATEIGAPLCDGLGDLVSLGGFGGPERSLALAYRILQGARLRTSWTEFISCPSCGRTLFDLEETTARIKERTAHLKGVKIAVMGCIVNGPGEMADADFGYVGSGVGKVNLYVGKDCVVRNVPEAEAPERLVELIRDHGAWTDPLL